MSSNDCISIATNYVLKLVRYQLGVQIRSGALRDLLRNKDQLSAVNGTDNNNFYITT